MATLKITGLGRVRSAIRKKIITAARSEDIRKAVGGKIVSSIQRSYFKAKPSTIKHRRYLEKKNKTHKSYKRPFVNFTFTGELLEDLRKNVKLGRMRNGVTYSIEHSDKKHKYYKNKKGRSIKPKNGKPTYREIQKWLAEKGQKKYDYLKFSGDTKAAVSKIIKAKLIAKFKRSF